MTYDNNNRGTLGRNTRREKDTHPEYSGKCEIDGKHYWVSGWVKEANGTKFFSLSFKAKDEPAAQTRKAAESNAFDDMPSDIPF